jgi:Tripartite tricarboxylate transporter TctB family
MRNPKDFWAGVIYIAFGLIAVIIARDYGMGTALRMGPGYFPTVLGGLLILIGIIALVRSFLQAGTPLGGFAVKALLIIVGSSLLFALIVREIGLLIALPILIIMSSYASVHFRWPTTLTLAAGITIFCVLVFTKGLGVPLPLLGSWLGG